ncbi:Proteasome subunit alpha type-5 [Vitis vinifera]|uniref:Proteasome subunit alpha type-5 n=1 Tax=Vitis vinifera TaxID=29760 RepID=A0A438K792_VITVI|nr:Proteasome subunit alpha type-5 [Vitis vinifera]
MEAFTLYCTSKKGHSQHTRIDNLEITSSPSKVDITNFFLPYLENRGGKSPIHLKMEAFTLYCISKKGHSQHTRIDNLEITSSPSKVDITNFFLPYLENRGGKSPIHLKMETFTLYCISKKGRSQHTRIDNLEITSSPSKVDITNFFLPYLENRGGKSLIHLKMEAFTLYCISKKGHSQHTRIDNLEITSSPSKVDITNFFLPYLESILTCLYVIHKVKFKQVQGYLGQSNAYGVSNIDHQTNNFKSFHSFDGRSRPFGVSLLIAGHDENGPSLYYTDPSGTFWQCNAKAIGSGSEGADSSLQEQFNQDLTLQEAETIALSILKQVMEEKVTPNNVDIAKVAPTYHLYTPAEVEAVISRL